MIALAIVGAGSARALINIIGAVLAFEARAAITAVELLRRRIVAADWTGGSVVGRIVHVTDRSVRLTACIRTGDGPTEIGNGRSARTAEHINAIRHTYHRCCASARAELAGACTVVLARVRQALIDIFNTVLTFPTRGTYAQVRPCFYRP